MRKQKLANIGIVIGLINCFIVSFVSAFLFQFNLIDDAGNRPNLIGARMISYSENEVVFSDIRPIVIFDERNVIARIRNTTHRAHEDPSFFSTVSMPSRYSTFVLSGENFNENEVENYMWFSFDGRIIKRIF
ncbi:MAG: hypothetical protein LBG64_03210 [Pseudomonadales bacterium]|jgi:hypothetical protein|nr:hypothetical protein [Pseudomonadales bacterium]